LPIAYYPALSDADIDKLLADDKPDTVEFMITPKQDVGSLQINKLAEEMQDVSRRGIRTGNTATDENVSRHRQVERIEITSANRTMWTSDSDLLRPLGLQPESSRPGGAEVGDIVWLAKRRKQPDVSRELRYELI
jgi:aspartyl-tRNA synthetase